MCIDTQDVDLDAVLGELCALESQYQSTSSLMDSEKIGTYLFFYTIQYRGKKINIFVVCNLQIRIQLTE